MSLHSLARHPIKSSLLIPRPPSLDPLPLLMQRMKDRSFATLFYAKRGKWHIMSQSQWQEPLSALTRSGRISSSLWRSGKRRPTKWTKRTRRTPTQILYRPASSPGVYWSILVRKNPQRHKFILEIIGNICRILGWAYNFNFNRAFWNLLEF